MRSERSVKTIARRGSILSIFFAAMIGTSCRTRDFDDKNKLAMSLSQEDIRWSTKTIPIDRTTYLFHYHNSAAAVEGKTISWPMKKDYLLSFLNSYMNKAEAWKKSKKDPATTGSLAAGEGLYVAEDPFSSEEYGDTLLILKAAPGSKAAESGGRPSPYVRTDVPAILYEFPGIFSYEAMVIRELESISREAGILIKKPPSAKGMSISEDFAKNYIPPKSPAEGLSLIENLGYHMKYIWFMKAMSEDIKTIYGKRFARDATASEFLRCVSNKPQCLDLLKKYYKQEGYAVGQSTSVVNTEPNAIAMFPYFIRIVEQLDGGFSKFLPPTP